MYEYKAKLVRVIDGDTFDLEVDCGFKIYFRERFRLLGVDTPETYGVKKESEEYERGKKATEFMKLLLTGKELMIQTVKDRKGKYGRYLVKILIDGEDAAGILLREGLAVKM